jgi:hypothetical protein
VGWGPYLLALRGAIHVHEELADVLLQFHVLRRHLPEKMLPTFFVQCVLFSIQVYPVHLSVSLMDG